MTIISLTQMETELEIMIDKNLAGTHLSELKNRGLKDVTVTQIQILAPLHSLQYVTRPL